MTRSLQLLIAVAVINFFLPLGTMAETPIVNLDAVISRALSESALVKEIEARMTGRRASGVDAAALGNPNLDSELRFPVSTRDSGTSSEIALALSQPLRLSDFGARSDVNRIIQVAADAEQRAELLAFAQRIRLEFVKTWALDRRARELRRYLDHTSRVEKLVKRSLDSALVAPGEGQLFHAEALKARYHLKALEFDGRRARMELAKIAGFLIEGELQKPLLSEIPTAEELLLRESVLPAIARATLATKLAREQRHLAELDAFPRFAPRVVFERNADDSNFVGIGLSIDLPFSNKNQLERDTKAADLAAAQSMSGYFTGEIYREEVRTLRKGIDSAAELLVGYEHEILPALRSALESEEKLFAAGQGSIFRVWQTLRELSEAEAETVERAIRLYSGRAELAILTGLDF